MFFGELKNNFVNLSAKGFFFYSFFLKANDCKLLSLIKFNSLICWIVFLDYFFLFYAIFYLDFDLDFTDENISHEPELSGFKYFVPVSWS